MQEYLKIYGPYKRYTEGPNRNRLIEGDWSRPEFEYLQNTAWRFTEKVDGTNIRVHWDGHKPTFGGRTDNAQIPAKLVGWLNDNLTEELFEQAFGSDEVTLYGEGYGAGIQKGGVYLPHQEVVLFDVRAGTWWLRRTDVQDVAKKMGLETVPEVLEGTLHDGIKAVRAGLKSQWGDFLAEGIVGVPSADLLDRGGKRIMIKIKRADFFQK